jgi:hypothetical protein
LEAEQQREERGKAQTDSKGHKQNSYIYIKNDIYKRVPVLHHGAGI